MRGLWRDASIIEAFIAGGSVGCVKREVSSLGGVGRDGSAREALWRRRSATALRRGRSGATAAVRCAGLKRACHVAQRPQRAGAHCGVRGGLFLHKQIQLMGHGGHRDV